MTDTRPRLSATADYLGNRKWRVTVWEGDKPFVDATRLFMVEADEDKEQSAVFQAFDKYIGVYGE